MRRPNFLDCSVVKASSALFSTGEAAFAVDHNGSIVTWNPSAERTFGHTEKEALGQRCWDLLQGEDLFGNRYCCTGCPLREMASHHKSVKSSKIRFRTASNEKKLFRVATLVVHDVPGKGLLVHLCHPEKNVAEGSMAGGYSHVSANQQRGGLTNREKEVLVLLSRGKSTKEMAQDMCISPATVRNHTQHILHKLNVHSRLAAVNLGHKLGLI